MQRAVWAEATIAIAFLFSSAGAQTTRSSVAGTRIAAPTTFVVAQHPLSFTASQRSMLAAAKARPGAIALRATLAKRPVAFVNLAVIDKSRVPVLVAARPELVSNLRVYPSLDRYTAATHKGATVYEINGTRLPTIAPAGFRLPPSLKTLQPLRPAVSPGHPVAPGQLKPQPKPAPDPGALQDVRVDHTESGVDVTFTRFGHIYNVSIDCGGPTEDETETVSPVAGQKAKVVARTKNADCSDTSALAFVQGLEVVGGGQQ